MYPTGTKKQQLLESLCSTLWNLITADVTSILPSCSWSTPLSWNLEAWHTRNTMASPNNVGPPTAHKWYTITQEWSCLSMDWVASLKFIETVPSGTLRSNPADQTEASPRNHPHPPSLSPKLQRALPQPPPGTRSSLSIFRKRVSSSEVLIWTRQGKTFHQLDSGWLFHGGNFPHIMVGCLKLLVFDWWEKEELGWRSEINLEGR